MVLKRKLLNERRFLKGQILDQSIVLETEYYLVLKTLSYALQIFSTEKPKLLT